MAESFHIDHNLDEVLKKLSLLTKEIRENTTVVKKLKGNYDNLAASQLKTANATRKTKNAMSGLHGMMIRLSAAIGARALFQLGKDAVKTAADIEAMQTAMNFATGSQVRGNIAFREAIRISSQYGLAMMPAIEGLTKLNAATSGTPLAGEPALELFKGISKAIAVLGLSSERSHGTYMAFEQIISKGKVSAEELRRQLGDRIPGAFQIAADAMSMTTTELDKLIKSGKLLSSEFIPKMAKELNERFTKGLEKAGKTTRAELHRLDNSLLQIKDSIGRELFPAVKILNTQLLGLSDFMSGLIEIMKEFPRASQFVATGLTIMATRGAAVLLGINPIAGAIVGLIAVLSVYRSALDKTSAAMHQFKASQTTMDMLRTNQASLRESAKEIAGGKFSDDPVSNKQMAAEARRNYIQDVNAQLGALKQTLREQKRLTSEARSYGMADLESDIAFQKKGSLGGLLGSETYGAIVNTDLDRLIGLRDALKDYNTNKVKVAAQIKEIQDQAKEIGIGAKELSTGGSAVNTGVATVNGSGNRILNITIHNVIGENNNNFTSGDIAQNESASDDINEKIRNGLYSILQQAQQIHQ